MPRVLQTAEACVVAADAAGRVAKDEASRQGRRVLAAVEAFRKELLEKTLRLKCLSCKKTFYKQLETSGFVSCPYCQAKMVYPAEEGLKGERLKKDAEKVASLVASFGMRALIALSTYGVGAEKAGRVLGRLQVKDEDFFRDLLDAQKTFIKNRKYWRA